MALRHRMAKAEEKARAGSAAAKVPLRSRPVPCPNCQTAIPTCRAFGPLPRSPISSPRRAAALVEEERLRVVQAAETPQELRTPPRALAAAALASSIPRTAK